MPITIVNGRIVDTDLPGGTRSSGSGSAFNPSPYRDPAYLELARTTDAATRAQVRGFSREAQEVRSELQRALPRLAWERDDDQARVDTGYESRGLYNSGARLVDRAKEDRDYLADYTDLRQRAAEAVAGLTQRASEAALGARQTLANAALSATGRLASQPSEQALADINRRNAALQDEMRRLLGQYRGY